MTTKHSDAPDGQSSTPKDTKGTAPTADTLKEILIGTFQYGYAMGKENQLIPAKFFDELMAVIIKKLEAEYIRKDSVADLQRAEALKARDSQVATIDEHLLNYLPERFKDGKWHGFSCNIKFHKGHIITDLASEELGLTDED